MTRKIFFALMMLITSVAGAFAQSGSVSGSIIDSDGLPLIGANVVVKGSTVGSITDIDGNFTIPSVPVGTQTIVASFIGYNSEEETVTIVEGQTVSIKFKLIEDVTSLDELIVIGYGTQKKEDKTGAVAHIKADELNGGVLTDPLQALAGKASGVVVTKGGGDPNTDAKIKIRGSSGISGSTDTNPLYVIDGIPGADPNMIAPEDIESYNILKDAASTAIYGSRGANGVIIITTKKGSAGNSNISFNMTTSIDNLSNKLDLYSAEDYRTTANEHFGEGNWTDGGVNTDWQDEIFRTGISQNYNLSASGGTEKSTYFASITHSNWEGVINGSGKERTLGKLNVSHKGLNDKLTLTGSLSAAFEENSLIEYDAYNMENVLFQAYKRNPTDPVYNEDGTVAAIAGDGRGFNYINPVGIIENVDKTDLRKKIMGNAKADLELMKGLNAAVSYAYISKDKEYKYYRPVGVYGGQGQDNGAASRFYELTSQKSLEATLNYTTSLNDIHNLNLLAGYSWQENGFTNFGANVENSQSPSVGIDNLESFIDVQYGDIESERNMSRLIGFFGRAQYNFDSKYYVSASIRTDGSTKFGEDEKWGTFPTASLGWNIHREGFMENISAINQLKLRGSYGVSGNQAFDPYYSQILYEPDVKVTDPVTGNEVLTWSASRNSNSELKWEKTTEINVGIDYAFLNSRLNGSIEYYNKTTDDLLNEYSIPQGELAYDRLWANSGVVINQGFELFLSYFAVDQTNFSWKTSLTLSKNKGKVTELGRYWTKNDGRQGWLAGDGMVGGDNWTIYIEEDQPLGNFVLYEYGYIALDEESNSYKVYYKNRHKVNENEPDYLHGGEKSENEEEGNLLDENDRYIAGNATPDIEIGWTNNFTFFKNWGLDFSLRSLIGQEVYNHTYGYFVSPAHMPDQNLMEASIEYREEGFIGNFQKPADNFMESASFLRLDYISLSYNFPLNESKYFKNLRLSVSSNNLFVLTNYTGSDPEMTIDGLGYGVDNFNVYPKTRTFSFGLNATF